jgi:hypothetical protein
LSKAPKHIAQELREARCPIDRLRVPAQPGVYGIFLTMTSLGHFPVPEDGLIYVGISGNLAEREFDSHFNSGGTGFSTLRRSLGAILKCNLALRARPRSPGPSETNFRCYCFNPEGEAQLSAWMHTNLEVGVALVGSPGAIEDELIPQLEPLLNLTKWRNPWAREIKALRKACADEARRTRC